MAAKKDRELDIDDSADTAVEESEAYKMTLDVQIENSGPCKKHVRVRIPRQDIEHYTDGAVEEFAERAEVPGFRIGHVPRKLLEKRFKKELGDQVKHKLLLASMEQLSETHEFDPINEPNIDFEAIDIPDEGDFEYEFDVEVRPEFELLDYTGLKIDRPTRDVTDADVEQGLENFLAQYGQFVPHEGAAQPGDYVTLSIKFSHKGEQIHEAHEITAKLLPVLRFQDAELNGFDKLFTGAEPGAVLEADLTVSSEAESLEMRGETVHATFTLEGVKRLELPELTKDFLSGIGAESEDDLRTQVREMLERQTRFEQRQATRKQVLAKITESATWELPEELVLRQVDNALRREILEMQQAGFTTRDIQTRENEIRQRAVTTTRQALKEHFVLDKIATQEKIEANPSDLDVEIQFMAMQRGESPRRVRARLQKSGMIENLEAQIRERKAVDFILDRAKFTDKPLPKREESRIQPLNESVTGMASQTVSGSVVDEDADEE